MKSQYAIYFDIQIFDIFRVFLFFSPPPPPQQTKKNTAMIFQSFSYFNVKRGFLMLLKVWFLPVMYLNSVLMLFSSCLQVCTGGSAFNFFTPEYFYLLIPSNQHMSILQFIFEVKLFLLSASQYKSKTRQTGEINHCIQKSIIHLCCYSFASYCKLCMQLVYVLRLKYRNLYVV